MLLEWVACRHPSSEHAQSGSYSFAEFPHVIDVLLPFMCTYLPTWWSQGPDNADPTPSGSHVTMVTSEHLNSLLRLILKLIMKHVGDEKAEWMTGIAVYAQQIIVNVRYRFLYRVTMVVCHFLLLTSN